MDTDPKLEAIAKKIIENIDQDKKDENFGAIITILIIISLVLTLIRIIQECNKSRIRIFNKKEKCQFLTLTVKEKASAHSWMTRAVIKKAIRKELSRDNYKKYGDAIMKAIIKTGEVVTDDEMLTLMETANV